MITTKKPKKNENKKNKKRKHSTPLTYDRKMPNKKQQTKKFKVRQIIYLVDFTNKSAKIRITRVDDTHFMLLCLNLTIVNPVSDLDVL